MTARAVLLTLLLPVCALALAGCGDGTPVPASSQAAPPPTTAATGPATPVPHDPPLKFASRPQSVALRTGFRLHGTVAYEFDPGGAVDFDGSMKAVDLVGGKDVWSVAPGAQARTLDEDARPLLAELGGTELVLGAVPVLVAGSGTAADQRQIRVIAVDAGNGSTAWRTDIPRPANDAKTETDTEDGFAEVAFANDKAIVVNLLNSVIVLDPQTHQVRWTRDGFIAGGLDGEVVAGLTGTVYPGAKPAGTRVPTGLSVLDGSKKWAAEGIDDATQADAGPGLTAYAGTDPSGERTTSLRDPATGVERKELDDGYDCAYDEQSVTVCAKEHLANPGPIVGLDTASATQLWTYPGDGSGRLPVEFALTFHGAVYGSTERGGVVLDARTGQDRGETGQVVPLAVSENLAVVKGGSVGSQDVYLAAG